MKYTPKYCVVGTDKMNGIRRCLSAYSSKEVAEKNLSFYTDRQGKKFWKYVRVAKYPYRPRKP